MNTSKPHILISNDDGIHAPGILNLVEAAQEFGEVTVVAPNSPQSGMGHAITIGKPLHVYEESLKNGLNGYALSGTPADCVKFATGVIMDSPPDLVLSGINHGSNSSISSIYSGTLSAAREAAMQGLPAIGFSLCHWPHDADMTASKAVAKVIIQAALEAPLGTGQLLNVNIPDLPLEELKGIMITKQAKGRWVEEFDEREDPYGRKYYWLTGNYHLQDEGTDSDEYALRNGYVSVTPMMHDLTAYPMRETISSWNLSL